MNNLIYIIPAVLSCGVGSFFVMYSALYKAETYGYFSTLRRSIFSCSLVFIILSSYLGAILTIVQSDIKWLFICNTPATLFITILFYYEYLTYDVRVNHIHLD